jgi:glycosyltransferase involved in cell wall biosynthesis
VPDEAWLVRPSLPAPRSGVAPVRVLEVTDLYRPVIGGLERHVESLAAHLVGGGHSVAVATSTLPGQPDRELDGDGVEIHRLRGWHHTLLRRSYLSVERPFHPTVPDPGYMRGLSRVVREFRPDVVHLHSWNGYSMLPVARACGVPVVATAHDYGTICARKTLTRDGGEICPGPSLGRCVLCAAGHYGPAKGAPLVLGLLAGRRLLRHVKRFTAVSRYVADQLSSTITPLTGRPVEVAHPWVADDLDVVAGSRPRPSFAPPGGYLLYVGALTGEKGLHALLDAHRRMPASLPLLLVGTRCADTPSERELGTGVTIATDVPHPDVLAAMAAAAVVVAPSICPDSFPTTVTEAQAVGAPLVASAVGGIPEQVRDGETAVLVPPGDAAALAAALERLVEDGDRRAAMAVAARAWARRFTASALAPAMLELLEEVAAARKGRPAVRA